MSIKNYGFFLVDNNIIYVDLYLYKLTYSSLETFNANDKANSALCRDWKNLNSDIDNLKDYVCYVDLSKDIFINNKIKSDVVRQDTIFEILNQFKKLLRKSNIKEYLVIGEHFGDDSIFNDTPSNPEPKTLHYGEGYPEYGEEENSHKVYQDLGGKFPEGQPRIVNNFLSESLKNYAVVRKPNKEPIYLESANVFANEYIFVKRLFVHSDIEAYFIYWLFIKIIEAVREIQGLNEVTLVSASDTGAMIVTEICAMANNFKGVVAVPEFKSEHMLHIGPKPNFQKHGFNFDQLFGNYIYIFDFMCEGNEYRNLQNLFAIKDAEFIGAFGVAVYDYPRKSTGENDNEGICALVDVKTWKEPEKQYIITYSYKEQRREN